MQCLDRKRTELTAAPPSGKYVKLLFSTGLLYRYHRVSVSGWEVDGGREGGREGGEI